MFPCVMEKSAFPTRDAATDEKKAKRKNGFPL